MRDMINTVCPSVLDTAEASFPSVCWFKNNIVVNISRKLQVEPKDFALYASLLTGCASENLV